MRPVNNKMHITLTSKPLLFVLTLYLATLALASFISSFYGPVWGIVAFFLILFGLLFMASITDHTAQRNVWIVLGMAPLIRIISLALPVILQISQFIWYIVIAVPVVLAVIAVMRHLKYTPESIGLTLNEPGMQLMIMAGGFFISVCGFYFMRSSAWVSSFTLQSMLFPAMVLIVFTGFVEELVFRGLMQSVLQDLGCFGWVFIALTYTVMQIGLNTLPYVLTVLVLSLFFGYMVKQTGSIMGVSLGHGIVNVGVFLLFPYIFVI